jgi:drug/metabolite transporter (DMT)-like permease
MEPRTLAALICTLLLWSSAFAAIRRALDHAVFSPGCLALLRFSIASVVLLIYALITGIGLPRKADLPAIVVLGLFGIAGYHTLLNTGQITVEAGTASLLINTSPIITALLARIFLKEHLQWTGWLGILVSFSGVAIIAREKSTGLAFDTGALFVVAAAACGSIYMVTQKPLSRRYSAPAITCYAIWCGTLLLLPFGPQLAHEMSAAPLKTTLVVVYLGVLPGAIGYVTWSYVLSRFPASRAASFLYLQSAFAFIIAWIWLNEAPTPTALVGGALTLAGVFIVNRWGKVSVPRVQPLPLVE